LFLNIDNEEIESLIGEVSSENISKFSSENVQEIVSSVLKRNKIISDKTLDIEFLENYLLLNENFLEIETYDHLLEHLKNISRLVQPESLELFKKLNTLFELELKEIKSIYELLNIALEINKVLNVFDSEIFSEDFESLLDEIDQFKKINNKNAASKLQQSKDELFLKLKPFQLRKFFITKKTIEGNARNVVVAKNILTSYKFDFQKINELTIATADIAKIFAELEGSREDVEENTNIKINEFTSIEELTSVLNTLLDSPIVSGLEQLAETYKTLIKFEFEYFRIFDLGKKENLENITKAIILKTILNKIYRDNLSEISEDKTELIEQYIDLDGEKRILQNIEQIKKQYNQNLSKAKSEYSNQALKIKTESNKRRRQANFRKILEEAEDIMLRVKPCWVMSPLVASQVLPRKELFDIVIFDEASQIQTSSAVTAIARGKKLVVAGDSKQLPPTNFFKTQLQDDFTTLTQDFDSILDVMDSIIDPMGNKQLEYHYRSKDERLITTSNISMKYNLNTIPGISNLDAIKFVKVETDQNSEKGSNPDEVRAVCEEISNHMLQNSAKSLVVIAFGSSHMKNIEDLFFKEYEEQPHITKYIEQWEDTVEPFRIKNLETVQGDERDFVILSVGYGKRDGKLVYNFGPINQQNGDRRLNVAASRAKEAMTVVSTITHEELLDSKMQSDGLKMFKSLLAYFKLESEAPDNEKGIAGLNAFDNKLVSKPPMNPIEQQIKRAIERLGYIVEPQYGVSGYFIDFVLAKKDLPGKWILAVEFDGARYHSSRSARDRDRLRQRNLENLGWIFFRIWSTDWFNDKNKVLKELDKFLKSL
jgi:superfamily I DNA and/or RNA helicase/very-short-patch-repair endonuclease